MQGSDYHVNDQVMLAGSHLWFWVVEFEKRRDSYWVKVRAITQVVMLQATLYPPVPEGWVHEDEISIHLRREPPAKPAAEGHQSHQEATEAVG